MLRSKYSHFWSPRVKFNENVFVRMYDNHTDSDGLDYFRISIDRIRNEPRFVKPHMMSSVQSLFRNLINKHTITVVYGNIGRLPHVLSFTLDICFNPLEEVRVLTDWWDATELDDSYEDDGTRCDVLVVLEPKMGCVLSKPGYAKRMVILTSHLDLKFPKEAFVIAHHLGNVNPAPIENIVDFVEKDCDFTYKPEIFIKGTCCLNIPRKSKICVDLTSWDDPFEVYLRMLSASDMLKYCDIKNWKIALKNSTRMHLEKFLKKNKRIIESKFMNIPCNVDGVNLMVQNYIDQFLKSI